MGILRFFRLWSRMRRKEGLQPECQRTPHRESADRPRISADGHTAWGGFAVAPAPFRASNGWGVASYPNQ